MASSSRLAAHREAARVAAESNTSEHALPVASGEAETALEIEEQIMTEPTTPTALAVDTAAIVAAANTRWSTVLGAEQAKGREATARALLSKTEMSAEDIIATLTDIPVAAASGDEGEGAAAVLAAITAAGNADLGAEGGDPPAVANHGWNDIHAEVRERRGVNR